MSATKQELRDLSKSPSRNLPSGVDLLRKINEGLIQRAPSEYVEKIRHSVTENCDELLEIGARIRPLMVDGQQVGWVRGVHNTERRRLSRWVHEPNEYIVNILTLATTLERKEIERFSALEIRNMVELIQTMTSYDVSLFPYLSAFSSTMTSENLWHGRGVQLTSFENKKVELPDGKTIRILAPSDHARLWATLCVYREQAKVRLDANWNAVLQARPLAGKSIDPLANDLKAMAKTLATDSIEPWEAIVKYQATPDLDDGWAHPENLDTTEGMLKELHGMMSGDKHEQFMAKFEQQQLEAAEQRKRKLERAVIHREPGVTDEIVRIESEAEVLQRERDLKKGRLAPVPVDRDKTETIRDPLEKIKRYQG